MKDENKKVNKEFGLSSWAISNKTTIYVCAMEWIDGMHGWNGCILIILGPFGYFWYKIGSFLSNT